MLPKLHLKTSIIALLGCLSASVPAGAEAPEAAAERMKWWTEARFGMFIHWSPSSVNGTEIGWGRRANRPLEVGGNGGGPAGPTVDPVYDNLYKQFNPTQYDAKEWVKLAEDAGMKYMVFTTKHHEGFSMWPTKARDGFDISDTPYKDGKGDILKDLADACHASKMRLGWYYSPRDWTHPDYGAGDNAKYLDFMGKQVDELLKNYGKIDVMWWDSFGVGDSFKVWHADKTLEQIHKLQPQILTNNRCSFYVETNRKGLEGDFDTPEQKVGNYQINRPWESCVTLVGHHWGFAPGGPLMSFEKVIKTLVSCTTGDGNLLLNVGPMPDGRIEPRQADLLREVGGFMKQYGESIYATRGGPFKNGKWGGATFRDKVIYVHMLPESPDTVLLPKLNESLVSSTNLTGASVQVTQQDGRIRIQVPQASRGNADTIIKLTFDQPVTRVDGLAEAQDTYFASLKAVDADATYTASSLVDRWSTEKDTLLKGACKGEFAFHTENEANPSIVIDLKKRQHIDVVAIENRPGGEGARTQNLTLSVSDDGKVWTEVWKAAKVESRWLAEPQMQVAGAAVKGVDARYVKLETHPSEALPLHLRSVRIYANP